MFGIHAIFSRIGYPICPQETNNLFARLSYSELSLFAMSLFFCPLLHSFAGAMSPVISFCDAIAIHHFQFGAFSILRLVHGPGHNQHISLFETFFDLIRRL
jgi:hypothetical protein